MKLSEAMALVVTEGIAQIKRGEPHTSVNAFEYLHQNEETTEQLHQAVRSQQVVPAGTAPGERRRVGHGSDTSVRAPR